MQHLAPNSHVKIKVDKNSGEYIVQSVSSDFLIGTHGNSTRTLLRADIRSIRFSRKGHSAVVGLGIGAALGAVAGVGVGSAINNTDSSSLIHVSEGKAAAVGAGVGIILGSAGGAIVGYTIDLSAGPVIYKR